MGIQSIIQSIMSLEVTKESLQNRMKALEIQAELRRIRDDVTKLMDSLSPIIKGRGRVAAQDEMEPVLVSLLNLTDEAAQALYDKLDNIDALTKCIQKSRPLGSLVGAIYRRLHLNAPIAEKHAQLAKLVDLNAICVSNIASANEKIITQLKRHGLSISIPAENSDTAALKQYYTLLEATITTYAEIDPYVKFYQQQHKAFFNMQSTLYAAKESAENRFQQFHIQLGNYFYNKDPVLPEQTLERVLVDTDGDNRLLDKSLERTNLFMNELRDKIDAELKNANLYLSFEDFCQQSNVQLHDNENEAESCANLIKQYAKDRNDKIRLLATNNPRFNDLQLQYSSIRRAERKLTDTTLSIAKRGAKHAKIANLVDLDAICVSNMAIAEENIITQLKRHGIFLSIPDASSDASEWKRYYATIAAYAETDPYVKLYLQQYNAFHNMQNILYVSNESAENRFQQFHTLLANYLKSQDPVPVQASERIQVDTDNDKIFLEAMHARTHVFMNEVRDKIDAELKKANLYTSFEEFCQRSSVQLHDNENEAKRRANLINQYGKDRNDKISLLATYDQQFKELQLQYSSIRLAERKLTDTRFSVTERRANFENYVLGNLNTLTRGDESAATKWLNRIIVFFATIVTLPVFGVGGYLAYRGLHAPTAGSRYVKDFKQLNKSLTEPLLPEGSISLTPYNSPR